MDLTPEQLENAKFRVLDDGGLAPDEVRALLRQVAARLRGIERQGVRGVSAAVSAVLDQAVKSSEEILSGANSDAKAVRKAAVADAVKINDEARQVAANTIAEGEKKSADRIIATQSEIDQIMADADSAARARSSVVISKAQQRLDRLLAAERDVHDRVTAALDDIQNSLAKAGIDQSRELDLTVEDPGIDDPASEANWADDAPAGHTVEEPSM